MKHLLATTALVALTAAPAFAESHAEANANAEAQTETQMTAQADKPMGDQPTFAAGDMEIRASDFLDRTVYVAEAAGGDLEEIADPDDSWERAGDISDVILTKDGQIKHIVMDAGGFLGIGEKQVTASMEELKFVRDSDDEGEFYLVFTGDRTKLEEREEFDRASIEDDGELSFFEDEAQMAETEMEETGAEAEQMAEGAETEVEQAGEELEQTAENAGEAIEGAASSAANEVAEAGAEVEQEVETETAEAEAEVEQETEVAEGEMTTETEVESEMAGTQLETEAEAEGATEMAEGEAAVEGEAQPMELSAAEIEALTAEELEGLDVRGANDEDLGEIGDLVISENGSIDQVIIDVGGFLGIGEKQVALKFDEIKILREGDGEALVATTNYTEAELEGMTEWTGQE